MGALHEGHLSLIRQAREQGDVVWVSVFVNPTQFGPAEDFERYPRDLEADVNLCAEAGADGVFAPPASEMYPKGLLETVLDVPVLSADLEGANRPGHFVGVCRVVMKLLQLIRPDAVMFGKKDYQQWRVIESMLRDLIVPVRVVGCETVREPDGLAMSSRNVYLTGEQREQALGLSRALDEAERRIQGGERVAGNIEAAMRQEIQAAGLEPDYAAVRVRETLSEMARVDGPCVALVAGRLGKVRLLDNREL